MDTKASPSAPDRPDSKARQDYVKPSLRVFGSVTALTAQLSQDKGAKDGGPNNFKT